MSVLRIKKRLGAVLFSLALMACNAPRDPSVFTSEFIFTSAPFRSCHASTIVETENGLVAAWFGGTRENDPDVGVWLSRIENGKWTAPVEVANGQFPEERYSVWNPVLFQPADGPLMLFYKTGRPWWGMIMTSDDNGKTWSPPRRLPKGILGPIKNKPVELANGDILAGSSTEDKHGWRVHFERTNDLGQTWEATPPLNDGEDIPAIQPTILIHPGGVLQALGRTRLRNRIFEIWSHDNGRTWGPMTLTELPNPSSGIDAVTLADGRHLLVYNHNVRSSRRSGRSPLNVAVSEDGKTWHAALALEDNPMARSGFSYPAVIQTSDGLVHVTYTWKRKLIKHVVIDPAKLTPRPIVDGNWPNK